MTKLMLAAVAATLLCFGARAYGTHDSVQLWEGGPYWATTNIGAEEPEDAGYYFWWGDTVGYRCENDTWVASDGSSSDFSFNAANTPTNGKSFDSLQGSGWITSEKILAPEHDAAHVHWGGNWRMPTNQELTDLVNNCDWTWTTQNSVNGYVVRGRGAYANNSIFLPAAGYVTNSTLGGQGSFGLYWSSDPSTLDGYALYAWYLSSASDGFGMYNFGTRITGQSVRPIQMAQIATLDITWLDDSGTTIDTTNVYVGDAPTHVDPTKSAAAPYRWVFTGWTPELEAAVSNTTYTATFKKIADLWLVESDWTAADGDEIVGEATHEVTIPGGAHVTINGVAVAGAGGGAAVDAPEFAEGGESVTTKFEKGEGNVWTITAFAEMSNESRGTDVTASQLKVYRASSLEGLKTAEAMTSGVTLTEKTSAVKVTLEAEAPTDAEQQFFRVDFGE